MLFSTIVRHPTIIFAWWNMRTIYIHIKRFVWLFNWDKLFNWETKYLCTLAQLNVPQAVSESSSTPLSVSHRFPVSFEYTDAELVVSERWSDSIVSRWARGQHMPPIVVTNALNRGSACKYTQIHQMTLLIYFMNGHSLMYVTYSICYSRGSNVRISCNKRSVPNRF